MPPDPAWEIVLDAEHPVEAAELDAALARLLLALDDPPQEGGQRG